mmetsp:Transcript_133178/g.230933  ORF Transcript_133178/g.230933 Transcript_133178/m.230933 type:complete len:631 (-) Transcript_133178:499-2391(-)
MERREGNPSTADFQKADELVREYLIFRGFLKTLNVFGIERKNDKVKGVQPDRIVEQFQSYITNFDPLNLIDLWKYMEAQFFSRLDARFVKTARKLEQSLKRLYVVNCVQTGNFGKCKEFFEIFAEELSADDEWRSWFMLPFLRNTELPPEFEPYFQKQWQEIFIVSIHNFISMVLANVPLPQIVQFDKLKRENASLLSTTEAQQRELYSLHNSLNQYKKKCQSLIDRGAVAAKSSSRRSLYSSDSCSSKASLLCMKPPDERDEATGEDYGCRLIREYKGHRDPIQGVRFSADGTLLAACTRDKVKIFNAGLDDLPGQPTGSVVTFDCMMEINCMEWNGINVHINKRLLTGHTNPTGGHGCIKVWSPDRPKCVGEISNEHIQQRVAAITVNPSGTICIIASDNPQYLAECSLIALNLKHQKVDTIFEVVSDGGTHRSATVQTMEFNHNGSCFVTGADDGQVRMYDVKQRSPLMSWQAHPRSVDCVHWKHDETSLFTVGNDHVITEWSIHKAGQVLNTFQLANCLVPSVIGRSDAVEYNGGWLDILGSNARRTKYLLSHDFSFSPNGGHLVVTPPSLVYQGVDSRDAHTDICFLPVQESLMSSVHWHPTHNLVFAGAPMNGTSVMFFQLDPP